MDLSIAATPIPKIVLRSRGGESIHFGFGFFPGLALGGLWAGRRNALARLSALTVLVLALLSTRFGAAGSLWSMIHGVVPGADAVRYVARIGQLLAFPAAVGPPV